MHPLRQPIYLKYTREHMDRFLVLLLKYDLNYDRAARGAGFPSRVAVFKLAEEIPDFKEAIENIIERVFDQIESNVVAHARRKKGFKGQSFLLMHTRKGRERGYAYRSELTGKDGSSLSWKDLVEESKKENVT